MAEIVLCRIDSRLIHGQVMTKWVNQSQANRIIVISDELVKDEFMKEIYLMSAPQGIKVNVMSRDEAIKTWKENKFGSGKVLLLLPDIAYIEYVYNQGIKVDTIQIGGLGGAPNRKVVFQNITLDDNDIERLKRLYKQNVNIIFQTIPEDSPQTFENILKKY
ncbi:PTS sugar transporter subunit IIB [Schnuerera sp. xch1]|uniref:PTS system mannose/fructose/N-acetylgalactosamine-transporter subunit IIB n=1 Tax=Schnuerera sp. xch1 TaxID=2874283 RepID=UPI001CC052D2|nr:PTS sugar transporter subunit IIB [Schnuerera sp. xch1]MBZ2175994.1 PTS sugar transporter subunit IIB [Schnuerera sp. xch1]